MNQEDLETLKQNDKRLVRLTTCDGEVMIARVRFVSDSNQDLIFDLISTTKESHTAVIDD